VTLLPRSSGPNIEAARIAADAAVLPGLTTVTGSQFLLEELGFVTKILNGATR